MHLRIQATAGSLLEVHMTMNLGESHIFTFLSLYPYTGPTSTCAHQAPKEMIMIVTAVSCSSAGAIHHHTENPFSFLIDSKLAIRFSSSIRLAVMRSG